MTKLLRFRWLAGVVVAGALGACVHTAPVGVAYLTTAPPGDRVEVVTTSPGTHYVWVGGHWAWRDNNYSWVTGSWVLPTAGYSVWVPGRWNHDGHGWYWTDGRWR